MAGSIAVRYDALAREIFEELEALPTVDAHEHLVPEAECLQKDADFYTLFEHYCPGDLVAAGASEQDMAAFADRKIAQEDRWARFKPYLSRIRTGSYARAALWTLRDLLGLPDLTDETYRQVAQEFRKLRQPGCYDRVLRERCNLAACIQCVELKDMGPPYFYHLAPSGTLIDANGPEGIARLSRLTGQSVGSLTDVLHCMDAVLAGWRKNPRIVGIKCGHAYSRSLQFHKTARPEAERAFQAVLKARQQVDQRDALAVQDFLMFEMAARAGSLGLPVVIHTGLQAGNCGRIADAHPLLLQTLIEENRATRFDLFHGGSPWVREIAVLAKYFPNVHLNMAWLHIISPAQARAALTEWLDMVPNTKIIGFGGDYSIVEKVYGHLKIARENVACVLAQKVHEGAWSRADASLAGRRLMRDNPAEFYGIALD